jgi:hypothetical protein
MWTHSLDEVCDVAVEHQPIGGVLDEQSAACERRGRDLGALTVQADRATEDVPQLDRPQARLAGVRSDGEGQVALLVAQADAVSAALVHLDRHRLLAE